MNPTLECQCPCGSNSVCGQAKAHPPTLLSRFLVQYNLCVLSGGPGELIGLSEVLWRPSAARRRNSTFTVRKKEWRAGMVKAAAVERRARWSRWQGHGLSAVAHDCVA